jgi:hypothetical protein
MTAMKKVLRYVTLVVIVSMVNAIVSIAQPTLDYIRGIGGTEDDKGVSVSLMDSSGTNITYTTGVFKSNSVNFNPASTPRSLSSSTSSGDDFYLGKYNTLGALVSSTSTGAFKVGTNLNDVSTRIYTDASQNIYVTGSVSGLAYVDRSNALYRLTAGSGIGYILKYNKDFTLLWAVGIGDGTASVGGARVNDISVDNAGNVYVTGIFQSPSPVDFNIEL